MFKFLNITKKAYHTLQNQMWAVAVFGGPPAGFLKKHAMSGLDLTNPEKRCQSSKLGSLRLVFSWEYRLLLLPSFSDLTSKKKPSQIRKIKNFSVCLPEPIRNASYWWGPYKKNVNANITRTRNNNSLGLN